MPYNLRSKMSSTNTTAESTDVESTDAESIENRINELEKNIAEMRISMINLTTENSILKDKAMEMEENIIIYLIKCIMLKKNFTT